MSERLKVEERSCESSGSDSGRVPGPARGGARTSAPPTITPPPRKKLFIQKAAAGATFSFLAYCPKLKLGPTAMGRAPSTQTVDPPLARALVPDMATSGGIPVKCFPPQTQFGRVLSWPVRRPALAASVDVAWRSEPLQSSCRSPLRRTRTRPFPSKLAQFSFILSISDRPVVFGTTGGVGEPTRG